MTKRNLCQSITVENSVCSGGHGLSIGSVGGRTSNTVDTVTFYNNEVKKSVNGRSPFIHNVHLFFGNGSTDDFSGIRIKAIEGDTGKITGVTYSGITLQSISK